ncbi:SixA phosphatase family protein [Halodurantibacterium flavum]|uniref:SixA phosphatase family protein n=1 Tax=Halodurantibacterium flavum TaxID=1382802 RepID=A0ABW4S9E9_9RHOB
MTLRLILMRHAKSSWDDPAQADFDRPLNARGRAAAPAMADWLASRGERAGQALVSSAARTRETFAAVTGAVGGPEVLFADALYLAGPDVMLRCLRQARAKNVIMIGHNPGIAAFAAALVQQAPAHPDFDRYPTCATLIAEFSQSDWAGVGFGAGRAVAFATPRTLDSGVWVA